MNLVFESKLLTVYLIETENVNFNHPTIQKKIKELFYEGLSDVEKIKIIYEFVRDEISHSWDIQSTTVTRTASEVLEQGTGICYAKSNLLAALFRGVGIPCGFCYQRLMIFDTPEKGYSLHAFNAVYIKSLEKWIRLDARGNKRGVEAEFSLNYEKLAFSVDEDMDEITYPFVYVKHNEKTLQILKDSTDALEMYKYHYPDKL